MSTYRPINERIRDFKPVEIQPQPADLYEDLKHCQDCGIPFCHACGCPLLNAVPEINAAVLNGRMHSALGVLLATSPFPEFTARVCPAPCEGSCVQGLNADAVPCRQVEFVVIEEGFAKSLIRPRPPRLRRSLQVGVVGSGPAGLAAAWRLNQAGMQVKVYEKDTRPGGFMRYGIPDFKLEKKVLDRRIRLLEQEGIVFECGVEVGSDISGRLLAKRHNVLVLAGGARQKRDLVIPGRDLAGVHFATDYLTSQNRLNAGEINALPKDHDAGGKRVLVIGGGDTGADCMGTAWRQGAISVSQVEILPKPPTTRAADNPWPQWPRTLRSSSSHAEGGERLFSVTATSFSPATDNAGHVGTALCAAVNWSAGDGAPRPLPVENSEFVLPVDLVLLAMGFTGAEDGALLKSLELKKDKSGRLPRSEGGRVLRDAQNSARTDTDAPDEAADTLADFPVYACGDAALGPSLVVRAMNDGLRVAERVIADFR
ncbi:MAG: glutamate synthase subunit beta [Desulfovibrio sp.]|jgi:glutamate synthase (NADPH/NADH) small chain|nr:glutamate synthase subunit beta [Desulfovibrio sp.]